MHILKAEGFITIDDTGFVKLTKAGQKIASRIYERHTVLTRLFINLGVNEKTVSDDACRIEHYISDESFKAIKKHMAQFC